MEEGEGEEEEEEEKEEEVVGKGLIFDKFAFSLETVGEGGRGAVSGEQLPAPPVITELMEGREVSEDPPLWEYVPTRGGEKETVGEVL